MISVMFIASSSGAMYAAISRYRSTVFGARFSSACCFMNSARSIARVVGIGAATPPVAAWRTSSSVRRTASASVASCFVANPDSVIKILILARRSWQGELVVPHHLSRPVFAFVDGHNVTSPYARFSVEVQSASRRCAPSFRRRAG